MDPTLIFKIKLFEFLFFFFSFSFVVLWRRYWLCFWCEREGGRGMGLRDDSFYFVIVLFFFFFLKISFCLSVDGLLFTWLQRKVSKKLCKFLLNMDPMLIFKMNFKMKFFDLTFSFYVVEDVCVCWYLFCFCSFFYFLFFFC